MKKGSNKVIIITLKKNFGCDRKKFMLINTLPRKSTKVKQFKNNSVFSEILLLIFENTKSRIPYLDQLCGTEDPQLATGRWKNLQKI